MSRIKDFTAKEYSGVAGFLISVEGKVNCGMLDVEPTITEADSQGPNPAILVLVVYPASDANPEEFRDASFPKNEETEGQYTEVQLTTQDGEPLGTIPVTKAIEVAKDY
jgi:hypothetical protein